MVLVPGRGLVERDVRVVACRRVDEAGEGLLQGVVEAGPAWEADPVLGEGGLGVVQEAGPYGVRRGRAVDEVDAGRIRSPGALVEEELGQSVGRERGLGVEQARGVLGVVAREEADAARPVEPPRAECDGLLGRPEGRGREAGGSEGGEERPRPGRDGVVEHGAEASGWIALVVRARIRVIG